MAHSHSHVNILMVYVWFKTFQIYNHFNFTLCCHTNLSYICYHNLNKEKYTQILKSGSKNFEAEIAHKEVLQQVVLLLSISETASNFGLLKNLSTKMRRKRSLLTKHTDHCPMLTLVRRFLPEICRPIPLTVDIKYMKTLYWDSTDQLLSQLYLFYTWLISAEQELAKLQRQYRIIEGDRRAYSEETQNLIRKQM